MDQADYQLGVDLPGSEADPVDITGATEGHRKADPLCDHFNKRKPPLDKAARPKRNHDAACKDCGTEGVGKPLILKKHSVDCDKATPCSHLHALKEQAKHFAMISEVHTETDIDFDHPVLTGVATSSAPLVRALLCDRNDQYNLDDLVSND